MYFDEISDKDLETFIHLLSKYSFYYYETRDLYIRVLGEYLRRHKIWMIFYI